jgi:Dyp-type peroxidase family
MGGPVRRVSRRSLLKAGGAVAALGAFGTRWRGLVDDPPHDRRQGGNTGRGGSASDGDPEVNLANIQGNVLAGFNKDHQRLLFFRFGDTQRARNWLATIVDESATSEEVLAFNHLFSRARARRGRETGMPQASWLNVALTHPGLVALGVPDNELSMFPDAFRQGMAARAEMLGDVDDSAPSRWVGPFASSDVHGLLILAADAPSDLDRMAHTHTQRMTAHGVRVVFDDTGRVRADQPGHEHFGFKDGVSQPGIRGVTRRQNPDDEDQGVPGQDLLWPGEFVLGYPTQIPTPDPSSDGESNGNPGPISRSGPAWTADGSYLVFRRLRQDVAGFRRFVAGAAADQGTSAQQLGAKLVGRYASGAPLERTAHAAESFDPSKLDPTQSDPSRADPAVLDPLKINNFEFAPDDADGKFVPRAAHIRKAYPRNEKTPTGGEADTQTHRILRRGIPYGESFREDAPAGSAAAANSDRGLLFLGYQASLEQQFEFIVSQWFNKPDHPERGDGHDPILSQSTPVKQFKLPGGSPVHLTMQRFIFTTGGAYLFQPSITALRRLARPSTTPSPAPSPRPPPVPEPPLRRPDRGRRVV